MAGTRSSRISSKIHSQQQQYLLFFFFFFFFLFFSPGGSENVNEFFGLCRNTPGVDLVL